MLTLITRILAIWLILSLAFTGAWVAASVTFAHRGRNQLVSLGTVRADCLEPGMILDITRRCGSARGVPIETFARTGIDQAWVRITTCHGPIVFAPDDFVGVLRLATV